QNCTVRKVDASTGIICTIVQGEPLERNRPITEKFPGVSALAIDSSDHLFIADGCARIWQLGDHGELTRIAGTGVRGLTGNGGAAFNRPDALAIDADGNILVADYMNGRIRRIVRDNAPYIASPLEVCAMAGVPFSYKALASGIPAPKIIAEDLPANWTFEDSM